MASDAQEKTPIDRTGAHTMVDRRGNVRRPTHAVFSARFNDVNVMGGGRDISRSGAYFVTSDEISLEVTFTADGRERRVPAKLVRIESLSPGTIGIALSFDRRLRDDELP